MKKIYKNIEVIERRIESLDNLSSGKSLHGNLEATYRDVKLISNGELLALKQLRDYIEGYEGYRKRKGQIV